MTGPAPAGAYSSALPAAELPNLPLSKYVLSGAARHPDRTALMDSTTGRSLTYGELHRQVHSLAGGMQAVGVTRRTVVGLMAPNITRVRRRLPRRRGRRRRSDHD